jgi:predicted ATPase/DNA-binding SARP family transcriptional activator
MVVEFRLLGTVEAGIDGRAVDLGSARQRCVLVALLMEFNHVVPVDQLIDRVWGERVPRSARGTLYSYLSRLRKGFAATHDVRIIQQSGGYQLTIDESAVDVYRFRRLIADARSADDERALTLFEQALALWRGEPFGDLDTAWLASIRATLAQERSAAALDHVDVALRCGQHGALLSTLSTLAGENPLDERVTGQLMLALYRSGRRAEALTCYQQARNRLAEELGTDPGPALQQLHHRILADDPALAQVATTPGTGPRPKPRRLFVGRDQELEHNLPTELTRFIGRSTELGNIERLVRDRRLVTLAGVGGCGKTRLAVRVGFRLLDRWPDGVWLVDLGPVTDPEQVPRLTATTLGVLIEPGGDPLLALAARLRQRRMLLCLDTCEHLLDAAAALADTVLRGCPGVSVLATSREPLGVAGETVWRAPALKEDEAVELFADRAGLVVPGFDVNAARAEVRAVCSRVDNIPLAVELAAAWMRVLSPAQIAASLDDRFRLLAGGPRRTIPRHQTLRASMAWSYALLDDDEQAVFRRMAVFLGTFTLEAVDAVCGGDGILDRDPLTMVGRLVDTSLVSVREDEDRIRYRLLDTVREYATEQLRATGELEAIRDRHLDYHLTQAESAQQGLETDQDFWRRELQSQHDNIHAALEWGLSVPGDHADRADRGRRLAAAMARQWFICGHVDAGLEFLRRAIDCDPGDRSALQGRLLTGTALLGMISWRPAVVEQTVGAGLRLAQEAGDDVTRARCLMAIAWGQFFSDLELCQAMARDAHDVAVAAGDPFSRDWATLLEAYTLTTRTRHGEATALARLAFERSWPRGDRFCAALAKNAELWAVLETGDLREATAIGESLMRIVTPLGDYFAIGTTASNVALVNGMAGDITAGLTTMRDIVRSIDEAPDTDAVAFQHTMGMLHLWNGDLDDALRWLERGIGHVTGNSNEWKDWTATKCLTAMVAALRRLGRIEEAETRAAQAVRLAETYGTPQVLADALGEQALLIHDTDPGRARDLHRQALTLRSDNHLRTYLLVSVDALAMLEAGVGNHAEAVRLLAAGDTARRAIGYPRPPVEHADYEAVVTALRERLGAAEFTTLWRAGSARSLDDTVAALIKRK